MENKKHCEIPNKSISRSNWAKHTKIHQNIQPVLTSDEPSTSRSGPVLVDSSSLNRKYCEACKKQISKDNWTKHIKSKSHIDRTQANPNVSTSVQILPPGPITNFPKSRSQRRRDRKEGNIQPRSQQKNHSQLPFQFYKTKQNNKTEKSLILDIKNEAKVKLLKLIEKHIEKDKNIDDIRKDINLELKEYFNRIKNLKELPNDPENFRPHHSENRRVGPFILGPFGKKSSIRFGIHTTKYRANINSEYGIKIRATNNDDTKERLREESVNNIYKVLSEMVIMCRERTNFRRGDKFRTLIFNSNFTNSGVIPTPLETVSSNNNKEISEQFVSSIAQNLVRKLTSDENKRLE
jgi:hypothetical protein